MNSRWVWIACALLALPACGSSSDGGSSHGAGGAAGAAGSDAGLAGAGGQTGGAAGVAGAGGMGAAGASGSGGVSGAADAGGAGGAAGASGTAGAGGNGCNDPGPEPNNTEPLASPACGKPPCDTTDCDDTGSTGYSGPLSPATGVIGPGDVDFFKYHGKDTVSLCKVNPTVSTTDQGYRLCAFVACDVSATHFLGCDQGTHEVSPDGLDGCCVDAPGSVAISHSCTSSTTFDDSATIYVRVDQANACTPYTVDYHF